MDYQGQGVNPLIRMEGCPAMDLGRRNPLMQQVLRAACCVLRAGSAVGTRVAATASCAQCQLASELSGCT